MIADLLHLLGVPGQFVLLASFLLGAYHFRELLGLAAFGATVAKLVLVFVGILVLGVTGFIPGFRVVVDLGELWRAASGVARRLLRVLPLFL